MIGRLYLGLPMAYTGPLSGQLGHCGCQTAVGSDGNSPLSLENS